MGDVKTGASPCVIIGDLVSSRRTGDRVGLHRDLERALDVVAEAVPPARRLGVTAGDEFQGVWSTLGEALAAAFLVRLELLPDADVRVGVGRGEVSVLDPRSGIEDGPGWWMARDAVVAAEETADRAATRWARTVYRADPPDPAQGAVDAALLCRDHLVGSMSDRSLRLLKGLMEPHTTQAELAEREGISASAVSQRVRADGIGVVLAAHELLKRLP
jgi:hypothetical protein